MAEYNFKKLTAQDIKTLFEESGETLGGAGATILNAKLIENYSNESDDDEEEMSIMFIDEDQTDISYEEAFAIILQAIEEKQQVLIKLSDYDEDNTGVAYYIPLVYHESDDEEEMIFCAATSRGLVGIFFGFDKKENEYYAGLEVENYVSDDDLDDQLESIDRRIPQPRYESTPACCVTMGSDNQPYWDELKVIEMSFYYDGNSESFIESSGKDANTVYNELNGFISYNNHYFPPRIKATVTMPEGQINTVYFNYQGFLNGSQHYFIAIAPGFYNLIITSDAIDLDIEY